MRNKLVFLLTSPISWAVLISIMGLLGVVIVIYSTVWGAVLTDDSYYYISSARNLIAGNGFNLAANFPPLLSLLLSAIGLFKVDPLIAIRWVNAFLFALNIYLVARIIFILTNSRVFSLIAGFFTLTSSTYIVVHSAVMSEPLFLTLTLCGVMVFSIRDKKESWPTPLLTGIFFGLAAATRYIGISLLLAGGIYWLIEKRRSVLIRFRNALIFSVVGIIPLGLWAIRNEILIGQPTNRVFAVHILPASSWLNMLNTIFLWFLPGRFVHGKELFLFGCLLLILLGWWLFTRWQKSRTSISSPDTANRPKAIAFITYIVISYIIILIISRSFFDERIPMDERLLSPILVLGLLLLFWAFYGQWKLKKWLEMAAIVLIGLVILSTNVTRSMQLVQSYHAVGRGYASSRDHISETYAYLRNRPGTPIYSNAFAAIYFWTGRVTFPLPPPGDLPALKEKMHESAALLVIFDSIPVELYGTTRDELTRGLVEQIRLSEATIYYSP